MGYIGTKPTDAPLTTSQLDDGLVTAAKLATDAVETAKVKDVNVTAGKLAATQDLSTKTITLPASVAGLGTGITNAQLVNNSMTLDGVSVALGGTATIVTSPTFTSVTPSTTTNDSTSFVIVGTNFGASGIPTVEFQNLTGGIVTSTSVVRDSATQLTVVATLPVDGTYYIRIELNSGLAVRSETAVLTISDAPVWTTGSGTLGTIAGDFSGAVATVAATGDTVTYSEVSGTGLTGAGNANCSLNSSTGAITTTDFGGSSTSPTTYNFTIRATDAQAQTADRAFSLTSSFIYSIDWLVVAGGGSGYGNRGSGGGGAGGFRTGASLELDADTVYTATVGDGGAAATGDATGTPSSGADSILSGTGITTVTSTGGGKAAGNGSDVGGDGGSGGGGGSQQSAVNAPGAGNTPSITPISGETTTVQGYAGGTAYGTGDNTEGGGGGGGASAVGTNGSSGVAGNGGAGTSSSITGSSVGYAGGGGAASNNPSATGGSATDGGGAGKKRPDGSGDAASGTANTGGGGGGHCDQHITGDPGSGGTGVVILRMLTSNYSGTTTGTPTVTTDGSYTVVKFTDDGSYTS